MVGFPLTLSWLPYWKWQQKSVWFLYSSFEHIMRFHFGKNGGKPKVKLKYCTNIVLILLKSEKNHQRFAFDLLQKKKINEGMHF